MIFIPELVTHITRFMTASETGIASRTCRTWYNNAYWAPDEVVERFREATAQRNVAVRDAIMERYTFLYPRLLPVAVQAGCVATTKRLMAENLLMEPTALLRSCDFTYALWANVPGARLGRRYGACSTYFTMESGYAPAPYDAWYDGDEDKMEEERQRDRGTRALANFYYNDDVDMNYKLVRSLGKQHPGLLADIKARQALLVKFLLASGAVPSSKLLHQAGRSGFAEVVRLLLTDGRVNPCWHNSLVLAEACENQDLTVMRLLLEAGCKISRDCFCVAIATDDSDVVQLLLTFCESVPRKGGNVWCSYHNDFLREAARNGKEAIVRLFLQRQDVAVAVGRRTIRTVLPTGVVSLARCVIARWETTNGRRYCFSGRDLVDACESGNIAMVRMVLSSGCKLDKTSADKCVKKVREWWGWVGESAQQEKVTLLQYLFETRLFISKASVNLCQEFFLLANAESVQLTKTALRLPCFASLRLTQGLEPPASGPRNLNIPKVHLNIVSDMIENTWYTSHFFQALYEVD